MNLRPLLLAVALSFAALTSVGHTGTLVLDIVDTSTAGTPLNGANWDGSAIVANDFGTDFRDFQFSLSSSPAFTFDNFIVLINADAGNKTGQTNQTIGVTIWSGPIVTNPVFSSSLATMTQNGGAWSSSGYEPITFGPGSLSPVPTITNVSDTFFFRVWATGDKNVNGFKAKFLSDTLASVAIATNVSPSVTMTNYDGTNTSNAPTFNYTGPVPTPTPTPPGPGPVVPEPGTWAMAGLLALVAGFIRMRRVKSVGPQAVD